MKKYLVTFKETYTYEKEVEIEDNEDIDEVIHDPIDFPTIKDLTREEVDKLNPDVYNEYFVKKM